MPNKPFFVNHFWFWLVGWLQEDVGREGGREGGIGCDMHFG